METEREARTVGLDALVGRLRELADAVTKGCVAVSREFTMRVPAEPERDADLVLSTAASEIERLHSQKERLLVALRNLHDEQNDAPLETRREQWTAAMRMARDALIDLEMPNKS